MPPSSDSFPRGLCLFCLPSILIGNRNCCWRKLESPSPYFAQGTETSDTSESQRRQPWRHPSSSDRNLGHPTKGRFVSPTACRRTPSVGTPEHLFHSLMHRCSLCIPLSLCGTNTFCGGKVRTCSLDNMASPGYLWRRDGSWFSSSLFPHFLPSTVTCFCPPSLRSQ